jgi:hypothetical protein
LKISLPTWLEKEQEMKGKTVVILQSNYIPWKGYFDLINLADEFIFYDDVQYTRLDWRNRNKVKTSDGLKWLSIPVGYDMNLKISDVEMKNQIWKKKHRKTIEQNYSKAPYFTEYKHLLEYLYENSISNLSEYNQCCIKYLSEILGIKASFSNCTDYEPEGYRTERLINILKKAGAARYISGPSAKNYLQEDLFKEAGIDLEYISYEGYPEYPQLHGPFVHQVSVIDLIFNTGKEATRYMKSFIAVNKI